MSCNGCQTRIEETEEKRKSARLLPEKLFHVFCGGLEWDVLHTDLSSRLFVIRSSSGTSALFSGDDTQYVKKVKLENNWRKTYAFVVLFDIFNSKVCPSRTECCNCFNAFCADFWYKN